MYLKVIDNMLDEMEPRIPFYIYISLNNRCNSNCIFCDVHTEKNKDCIIDIYSLIDELKETGTQYVHFMGGGEPFVDTRILDYAKYISEKGMKVAFTTNGLALNREKIEFLSTCNVSHFFFSIDGYNAELHDGIRRVNGIWKAATTNIKLIKEYMPSTKIIVNHVLNNRNIDYLENMIDLSEEVPFDHINLLLVKGCPDLYFSDQQVENYNANLGGLRRKIDKSKISVLYDDYDFFGENKGFQTGQYTSDNYKCYFAFYSAYIDCTSGDVFPCDCTVHRDRQKYLCGNLLKQSFKGIWTSSKMEMIRKEQLGCPQMCKENCDFANIYFNQQICGGEEVV